MTPTDQIARDPQTGLSKGYGFVSYTDFESADAAIESMNGQFLMNKPITVQFAFKKDGKGERHGTASERLLASQARKNNALPLAPRPPSAAAYGTVPPVSGFAGPYQGQFAGALATAPPPPPGFASMPMQTPMQPQGPVPVMPLMGMPAGMQPPPPPPPGGVPMFNPSQAYPPPPPPGFASIPGGLMTPPPTPPVAMPPYVNQ